MLKHSLVPGKEPKVNIFVSVQVEKTATPLHSCTEAISSPSSMQSSRAYIFCRSKSRSVTASTPKTSYYVALDCVLDDITKAVFTLQCTQTAANLCSGAWLRNNADQIQNGAQRNIRWHMNERKCLQFLIRLCVITHSSPWPAFRSLFL